MVLKIPNDADQLAKILAKLIMQGLGFSCVYEAFSDQWVVTFNGAF